MASTLFVDISDADRLIFENTRWETAPLTPEIPVRLLKAESPLWQAFGDDPEANQLPRHYWALAWSGGQALARYILDHPEVVRRQRVLDFCSGCGIAGIAAAKMEAEKVTASDIDPTAVRAIRINSRANGIQMAAICEDLIYTENPGWTVVLAGDIWYDSRLAGHGQKWLRRLAGEGILVLTADPGRGYSPSRGIEPLAQYRARSVPDLEHPDLREVTVYRLLG